MNKVNEIFPIDEDFLIIKSTGNEYWENCSDFWDQVKDKDLSKLTAKQVSWLERILEEQEKYMEGKL